VGKTETAKALAHVFFGSESNMHRFDMTEFSDSSSLTRLIGTADTSGMLADALREKPYAVVLLDEFEKASQVACTTSCSKFSTRAGFTDGRGEVVNARNTIIIATSNAGSDLIMRTVAQRGELATLEGEIIDHIIKSGTVPARARQPFRQHRHLSSHLNMGAQTEVAQLFLRELGKTA
jgi:ATP-dependent Clp protease ATP-binding subunit ClpC